LANNQGSLTNRNEYNAFGEQFTNANNVPTANSIGYTGQRLDNETGLMALGNGERYYSPQYARFIQQDSFAGMPEVPQSLNRFSYVHNNPTRFTDPSGHIVPLLILGGLLLGVILGGAYSYASQTARIADGTMKAEDFSWSNVIESAGWGGAFAAVGIALALSPAAPVAIPLLIGAGVILGGKQIVDGAGKYGAGRKNEGAVDIVFGTITVALSLLGARSLIKTIPVEAEPTPFRFPEQPELPFGEQIRTAPEQPVLPFEENVRIPKAETIVEETSTTSSRHPNQRSLFEPEQSELDFRSRGQQLRDKYGHLTGEERLARIEELKEANFNKEVDNAIDNAVSHNLYELPGKNPTTGEGLAEIIVKKDVTKPINYHHNMEFQGIKNAPGNQRVEVRYHSPNNNPNAAGTYSSQHPTVQINKYNSKNFRLPDGTWKSFNTMTPQEKADIHMP
jgi:RHS repeat-associated protein